MSSDKIYTMLITKEITHIESHYGDPLTVKHDNSSYATIASEKDKKYNGMIISTKEQHKQICSGSMMLRLLTDTVFGEFIEGEDNWHISVIETERVLNDDDAILAFKKRENEISMKNFKYKRYKDVD